MSETIVFFGSGPVAAKSLELLSEWIDIEAVITKPQPPHHKDPFPVLVNAKRLGLKTYTPVGKKALSELIGTKPFNSRLGIIIDYGFIVNQEVIDYFPLGIINSHFSLLPEWRGADPITFAVLSGQKRTGVSLMLLVEKMDEGPILAFSPYNLSPTITTPELTAHLIQLSDELLQQEVPRYLKGKTTLIRQEDIAQHLDGYPGQPTYSRKLTKQDGIIDWHKPAVQIEREIRAFIEWPKSRTKLGNTDVIITKAHAVDDRFYDRDSSVPQPFATPDGFIGIPSNDSGILVIERLKPVGKQEMSAKAFLAGYPLT